VWALRREERRDGEGEREYVCMSEKEMEGMIKKGKVEIM